CELAVERARADRRLRRSSAEIVLPQVAGAQQLPGCISGTDEGRGGRIVLHCSPDCPGRSGERRPAGTDRRDAVARVRSAAGHRLLAGSNCGLLRCPTLLAACRRNCIRSDRVDCAHILAGLVPCIRWPGSDRVSRSWRIGRATGSVMASVAISSRADRRPGMIWTKIIFGGLGRRGFEAAVAGIVLAAASALVAGSLMVVQGARYALAQAERNDRPEIVQIRSRFNRALFETPRSGNLPPLTLPVYEPLIEPEQLSSAAGDSTIVARQSLFRNVV